MKAIIKEGPSPGAAYLEVPRPEPGPGEIQIEIAAAAICGTDVHLYQWDASAISFMENFQVKFPLTLGHEIAGTVTKTGAGVTNVQPGDRVSLETHIPCGTCYQCQTGNAHNCAHMGLYGITYNGAFGDYAIAPANLAFVLRDGIRFEEGALFEPAAVAMRGIEEAAIQPGDTVVIYGCGPIGLVAIQMARICGAAQVLAVDVNPYRLELAKSFGAKVIDAKQEDAVQAVLEQTRGRHGADVLLEATGVQSAYESVFRMLRLEGRLVSIGHPAGEVKINITRDINQKGIQWKGVFGRRIWQTWWNLASLVESGRIHILDVVTHRFPFDAFEQAFETTHQDAGKVLFLK